MSNLRGREKRANTSRAKPVSAQDSIHKESNSESKSGSNKTISALAGDVNDMSIETAESSFDKALNMLSDKAGAYRVTGCIGLGQLLNSHPDTTWLSGRVETVAEALLKCIVKPGVAGEAKAACRAMQVLLLIVPEAAQFVLDGKMAPIAQTIKKSATPASVRAALASLLASVAIGAFLELETNDHEVILQHLEEALAVSCHSKGSGEGEVQREVCKAWSAVASIYSTQRKAGELHERMLNTFAAILLDEGDIGARLAASEAMAMLIEAKQHAKDQGMQVDYGTSGASSKNLKAIGHTDLTKRLEGLVDSLGTYAQRNERNAMKHTLENVLSTIELKMEPSTSVTLAGKKTQIKGWSDILQYQFLASIGLGELSRHFSIEGMVSALLDTDDGAGTVGPAGGSGAPVNSRERKAITKEKEQFRAQERRKKESSLETHDD